MTTLGRLIFLDQPGTGASDPVTPAALPTLEQWADSITAVLDDLGSREAVLIAPNGGSAPAALFAATHPSRTTALVVLECRHSASRCAPDCTPVSARFAAMTSVVSRCRGACERTGRAE